MTWTWLCLSILSLNTLFWSNTFCNVFGIRCHGVSVPCIACSQHAACFNLYIIIYMEVFPKHKQNASQMGLPLVPSAWWSESLWFYGNILNTCSIYLLYQVTIINAHSYTPFIYFNYILVGLLIILLFLIFDT